MSRDDQLHWDEKWSQRREDERPTVCALVIKYRERLSGGRALDIACGLGQNAIWLAQQGFDVDAVDISPVALARARTKAAQAGVRVNFIQLDLESGFSGKTRFLEYDVIVVRRFLNRRLWPVLRRALAPGGWLFYETFNRRKQLADRDFPEIYLLEDGELLRAFGDLEVIESGDDGGERGEVSWVVVRNV